VTTVLVQGAVLNCGHAPRPPGPAPAPGDFVAVPSQTALTVGGRPVLLQDDIKTATPGPPCPLQPPCAAIATVVPAPSPLTVDGAAVADDGLVAVTDKGGKVVVVDTGQTILDLHTGG
jgi:hypothetical protein